MSNFSKVLSEVEESMKPENQIYKLEVSKKDGKLISYTPWGKVVIVKNPGALHPGFAKMTRCTDKGNCYLAKMKNVAYDYYDGIPYEELQEVLKLHNFELQYKEPIDEDNEFSVWADLSTGNLVTVETWNDENRKTFESVNVTIPVHGTVAYSRHVERMGFSSGGYNTCSFDLCNSKVELPLALVLRLSDKSRDWSGDTPILWHWNTERDEDGNISFIDCIKKVYYFKDDLDDLFNFQVAEYIRRHNKII